MIFILDGALSIGDAAYQTSVFDESKTFVVTMINNSVSNTSPIGVIVYGAGIRYQRPFYEDQTRSALIMDINAVTYPDDFPSWES